MSPRIFRGAMASHRFLIVRLAAIGDVALTTPLVRRIRQEYPDAHVTWLCGSRVAELVKLLPGVDEVIAVNEIDLLGGAVAARARGIVTIWRLLAGRSFDRILLLHPDPRYRVLVATARGPIHVAQHPPGRGTNPIPGRFRGDECARLLDQHESRGPIRGHYELLDLRQRVAVDTSRDARPRIVLVPGGARNVLREDALRRWPISSYAALARETSALGGEVVLIGDTHDTQFAPAFDGLDVRNLMGATTLTQTLSVLQSADVVVSHDTGPLHLARLVRAPIIALFGPTDPAQFVGADDSITVIWGGADLACRPCYDGRTYAACADNICIGRVRVEDVLAAVRRRVPALGSGLSVART